MSRTQASRSMRSSITWVCALLLAVAAVAAIAVSAGAVTTVGVVTTFAGTGAPGHAAGTATTSTATFGGPYGGALDSLGNVYVAEHQNQDIRKIAPDGVVTLFAGSGTGVHGSTDGTVAALFNEPTGVAIDKSDNLYVADMNNNRIRKITPDGVVSSFSGAGTAGAANGASSTAQFRGPDAICIDAAGTYLYVAESGNDQIRKVALVDGSVETFAGSGLAGSSNGASSTAQFRDPRGVDVDANGNVYVGDSGNHKIRVIAPDGTVSDFAGSGLAGRTNGATSTATFGSPRNLSVDNLGTVYVADQSNNQIRTISGGVVSLLAGSPTGAHGSIDGTGTAATFESPSGLFADGSGSLFVGEDGAGNDVRKVSVLALCQIVPVAGDNGTISPSATQTVSVGSDSETFTISPATGYHVADVVVGGSSVGAVPEYKFTNVTTDSTISATFAIDTFQLNYDAGVGGSVVGTASQTVDYDTDGTAVMAVPDTGYHFVGWSDDVTDNPRTDAAVHNDVTVTAIFAIDTFQLHYAAGAHGSISGSASQTVGYNTSGSSVTAVPDSGYHFVRWSDDVTANPRSDAGVTSDLDVSAEFAISPKAVTRLSGINRYATAIAAALDEHPNWTGVRDVVIASGETGHEPDALTAAGLAGAYDAPLLLVPTNYVDSNLHAAIAAMPKGVRLHLVGGAPAVSSKVASQLKAISKVASADRYSGADRYGTAAAVARKMKSLLGRRFPKTVFITNGGSATFLLDPLTASTASASKHFPVLLVSSTKVPAITLTTLSSLGLSTRFVVGGPAAVPASALVRLNIPAGNRIAGADVTGDAVAFADKAKAMGWLTGSAVGFAAGVADAATGGAYMGKKGGPLLLVAPTSVPSSTGTFLTTNKASITDGHLFGGIPAVTETVRTQLEGDIN